MDFLIADTFADRLTSCPQVMMVGSGFLAGVHAIVGGRKIRLLGGGVKVKQNFDFC